MDWELPQAQKQSRPFTTHSGLNSGSPSLQHTHTHTISTPSKFYKVFPKPVQILDFRRALELTPVSSMPPFGHKQQRVPSLLVSWLEEGNPF